MRCEVFAYQDNRLSEELHEDWKVEVIDDGEMKRLKWSRWQQQTRKSQSRFRLSWKWIIWRLKRSFHHGHALLDVWCVDGKLKRKRKEDVDICFFCIRIERVFFFSLVLMWILADNSFSLKLESGLTLEITFRSDSNSNRIVTEIDTKIFFSRQ